MTDSTAGRATLLLLCVDLSRPVSESIRARITDGVDRDRQIVVGTKSDLPADPRSISQAECDVVISIVGESNQSRDRSDPNDADAGSGRKNGGQGREALSNRVAEHLAMDQQLAGDTVVTTAVRCRRSLDECLDGLKRARQLCISASGDELIVSELRLALDAIGQVVGVVYTDDVLDRVFSRFCIGK